MTDPNARPSFGRTTILLIRDTGAKFGEALVQIIVGLVFLAGGIWLVAWTVQHPPLNKLLLYGGGGVAIFGALLMPTIFKHVREIVVFVVPYLPLIGGRRASDPPASVPPENKG